jgi:hypothetical protein
VALQLMQAGYTRVAVVRGGFPALMEAGVAVAPKDVTPVSLPAPSSAGGDPRPVGNLA